MPPPSFWVETVYFEESGKEIAQIFSEYFWLIYSLSFLYIFVGLSCLIDTTTSSSTIIGMFAWCC